MNLHVINTNDGSKTIYVPELDETYHSSHGAIQEAVHIFINNGIKTIEKSSISIFEMGFGTGLNALLTAIYAKENNLSVNYTGIEAYPVPIEIAMQMEYCKQLSGQYQPVFAQLHQVEWNQLAKIIPPFSLHKIHARIEDLIPPPNHFDCVYFDAFGPQAQEDMWTLAILEKMYNTLKKDGFLITYCAKGQVKRTLKSIGFEIEALPGPPGKREITRAWKR
ncbi:MAG: tRNA (5-methylaminomethyl-2-thiouridine)(34)-methyltransferase MnmD [Crocinitomicaceae bacterium]|nr:tRNA (5-methylaminomethyl-2-thiouridine)(34)-methyltransferase MnmD [Crocinitomicaceae bacterium]